MDSSEILPLVSRWFHIIPAIVLVGGTIFMRLALAPAASAKADSQTAELRESIRRRWAKWVMISTALLLISGLYNAAIKAMGYEMNDTPYNALLGIKILLALGIFYLAAVLSGRSEKAKRFRENELKWLNTLCVLMLSTILIAGFMKMDSADYPRKVRDADQSEIAQLPS